MSDFLRPHESQHARLLYPSPTPRVYSNSRPLGWWCHPTISSAAVPFSRLQSFPALGFFQMTQLFAWGGENIGVSAQHQSFQWTLRMISFTMDWLDLLAVQGSLKSFLQHRSSKVSILLHLALFIVQFSYPHMTNGKTIALTRRTFVGKVMSLLFNILSRLVITFKLFFLVHLETM